MTDRQPPTAASGPQLFLRRISEREFLRTLAPHEAKDRHLLVTYFNTLRDNSFEVTPDFLNLVRNRGVPQRYRWLAWRAITGWSPYYKASAWDELLQCRVPDPKIVAAIEKDLDRTFPRLEDFDDERKQQLASVLRVFACVFPKVGYCQGMNFVAGFILLSSPPGNSSPDNAFFMLVEIMSKYGASLLFCDGLPLLKLYTYQFRLLLERLFPDVHKHLLAENITPELYATKWFLTAFTQPLPFEVTARLWDLIVCDGLQSLVHIALATIKLLRSRLLQQSADGLMELLSLRGPTGLPTAGSIVGAALGLKRKKTFYGSGGVDARLEKLRCQWARENPFDAEELENKRDDLCSDLPLGAEISRYRATTAALSGHASEGNVFGGDAASAGSPCSVSTPDLVGGNDNASSNSDVVSVGELGFHAESQNISRSLGADTECDTELRGLGLYVERQSMDSNSDQGASHIVAHPSMSSDTFQHGDAHGSNSPISLLSCGADFGTFRVVSDCNSKGGVGSRDRSLKLESETAGSTSLPVADGESVISTASTCQGTADSNFTAVPFRSSDARHHSRVLRAASLGPVTDDDNLRTNAVPRARSSSPCPRLHHTSRHAPSKRPLSADCFSKQLWRQVPHGGPTKCVQECQHTKEIAARDAWRTGEITVQHTSASLFPTSSDQKGTSGCDL